ncbi:CHAT domain-containing protein [Nemania abortiva]|nr:CHAT domain-containing protein [Nemania abortiva]
MGWLADVVAANIRLLLWTMCITVLPLFLSTVFPIVRKIRHRTTSPHPEGIEPLGTSPERPDIEIVAVHGLGAHPEYTWTRKVPTSLADQLGKKPGTRVHLLKDLLKDDFKNASVLNFGYNADWFIDAAHLTAQQTAEKLIKGLREHRSKYTPGRAPPIVFIGHSYGGIVICNAKINDYQDLLNETRGIFFLGTPHQGSDISIFAIIAARLTAYLGSNQMLPLLLQKHKPELSDLNDAFLDVIKGLRSQIFCFVETKPTYLFKFISIGPIVDRDSASGAWDRRPINTNHSGLNKCLRKDDPVYSELESALRDIYRTAREQTKMTEEERKCLQVFCRTDSDYQGYKNQVKERLEGTCGWFLKHPNFQNWLQSVSGPLLVSADPGCGKSVLAKYLIDNELPKTATICYFFFKDQDQNTAEQALCALLHQLFQKKPSLIRHAIPDFETSGGKLAGRTSALISIFKNATSDPKAGQVICVLDALDECAENERKTLTRELKEHFLVNNIGQLKILLTSRPYDNIVSSFQDLENRYPQIRIPGEDESEEISSEVNVVIKHRVNSLAGGRLDPQIKEHLKGKLLAMEHRTYLWSYLVFDHLESSRLERTKGFVESIVENLPPTVDDAYERILSKSKNQDKLRKILQIILAAERPLTLKEMQVALKTMIKSKPTGDQLENDKEFKDTLRDNCGLFVCVHEEKIYFLHQTAKEFLIWDSLFISPTIIQWKNSIKIQDAHTTLTEICLSYLILTAIENEGQHITPGNIRQYIEDSPFLGYSAKFWVLHYGESDFRKKPSRLGEFQGTVTTEDYQSLSGKLDALSRMLGDCHLLTNIIDALEIAVGTAELAVSILPKDHPDLMGYLENRGIQLARRYMQNRAMHDLERAFIDTSSRAVDPTPQNNPDRASRLNNLGNQRIGQFERPSLIDGLNNAIIFTIKAIILDFSRDHIRKANDLRNLGSLFRGRFEQTGSKDDLTYAIFSAKQAVDIIPEDSPGRASHLSNLGDLFYKQFELTGLIANLDYAINAINRAVDALPDDHPHRANSLGNLGSLLETRSRQTGSMNDLHYALSSYEAGWRCRAAPPFVRIQAAWAAAKILASQQNWEESRQLLQEAINFLSIISPRLWEHTDKQSPLADFAGLASMAAATALNSGKSAYDALRLFELGRGVIVSSLVDMRVNLSELKQRHPNLAAKLASLRAELDSPSGSQTSSSGEICWESQPAGLREANQKFSELIIKIRAQPGFDNFLLPPTKDELMHMANRGPIVVINMSLYRCDAFLVERNQIRVLELPRLTLDEAQRRAADLRLSQRTRSSHNMKFLLKWLWDTICCPVLDALGFKGPPVTGDNWPRVWWIPTDDLSELPLHASGDYTDRSNRSESVLDRVIPLYTSSIEALMHGRRSHVRSQPRMDSALLVPAPRAPGLATLLSAAKEKDILREHCPFLQREAINPPLHKDDVLRNLQTCKSFHFAGHAWSNPVELPQGFLLPDDWKSHPPSMGDLHDLGLQDSPLFLAYLWACSAGANHAECPVNEGIYIVTALQLAGFRHVIGTLWAVSDQNCVNVARVFYETLLQEGMTDLAVCRGLHRAVRALRNSRLYDHGEARALRAIVPEEEQDPTDFDWASYILFGV